MKIDEGHSDNKVTAVSYIKEIKDKVDKILGILEKQGKNVNIAVNRTNTQVNNEVGQTLKEWYGLKVPSYIPDISGKQIYKLSKMGWTVNQICAISGFSPEEAKKKYETYVRNNV